jgi:nucleoid DNA-binding protein
MSTEITKPTKKINLINDIPDIVKSISNTYGITKKDAEDIIADVFNSIKDIASTNGVVGLKNFGSFKIRHKPKMRFYDFATGKVEEIDRNVLVFYPSAGLKDLVNSVTIGPDGKPTRAKNSLAKAK